MIRKHGKVIVTATDIEAREFEFVGCRSSVVSPSVEALRWAKQRISDALQKAEDDVLQELAWQIAALEEGGDDE